MDLEARKSLGVHEVQVKDYVRPRLVRHQIVMGLCVSTYLSFILRPFFAPGSKFYVEKVEGSRFWETIVWMQGIVIIPMFLIHFTEIWLIDRKKLKRFDVEIGSLVWWKWMISCFMEGFGAFERIDWLVDDEEKMKLEKSKTH